jgi:hypothetical protein
MRGRDSETDVGRKNLIFLHLDVPGRLFNREKRQHKGLVPTRCKCSGLPDLFGTTNQNGKKYTKRPQNIPNGHKYTNWP